MAKVVHGLISEWKDLKVIDKVDVKNRVPSEEREYLVVEMRFPTFVSCMKQRFIKVTYEKKLSNIKNF